MWVVTSAFNTPRDYSKFGGKVNDKHEGVDVAPTGPATSYVLAVADGVVTKVDIGEGYGNYCIVTSNYNGTAYSTWRAHMASVSVSTGQIVKKGDVLGISGDTGNSTGRHDHLTMTSPAVGMSGYIINNVVDPTPFYPKPATTPSAGIDLLPYVKGDGRIFEVQHSSGGTETFQYQSDDTWWYLVKNSQWEQLYSDASYIWRGADTSPGGGRFYVQFEPGLKRARWMPRYMAVGQSWTGPGHAVQFYHKDTCAPSPLNSGNATNKMTFKAKHAAMTWNGITIADVVELTNGTETYFYAKFWGLVAWSSPWGNSAICETFAPGQRPDLTREQLNCSW